MKILIVTTISPTIGFLIPHIRYLIDEGHKVDVAFNIVKDINPMLIELGCKIHNMEFQRSPINKDNYIAYKRIKNLVLENKYDLVHTHTPIASFLTRLACRSISNIRILYTAHGFHFYKGAPIENWLTFYMAEKLVGRWTDGLITMNEEDYIISKKIISQNNGCRYKVHGVGIDLKRFQPKDVNDTKELRQKYGYTEDDFILFYAAELNKNKHQDLLIESISELKTKIPNIKLLLAGPGPSEETYKKLMKELNLEKNVELLGFRSDVKILLKLSDIAVASSRREGLPVNVMEAMATGLPIVATDIRGHRDLIEDGVNGYLVGVEDVDGFTNAIAKLYHDKTLRERFGRKGIELVQKYSLENVLEEMKNIYEEQLGGNC